MVKYNTELGNTAPIANYVSLLVKFHRSYHNRSRIAAEVCNRFLELSKIMPQNEFIGWQVNVLEDEDAQMYAFVSPGVEATEEDFAWVFEDYAEVKIAPAFSFSDLFADGRKVYALQPRARQAECLRQSGTEYEVDCEYSYIEYRRAYLKEAFCELKKLGTVIRLIAKSDARGQGTILFSLPGEMGLKMRALLSLAFGETAIRELNLPEDVLKDAEPLSEKLLAQIFSELLEMTGAINFEEAECEQENNVELVLDYDDDDAENENRDADQESDCLLIEELDLSVRSYNCLKRAGINYVEQLRAMTDEDYAQVRNLGKKSTEEIKRKLAGMTEVSQLLPPPGSSYADMLHELIGLENVKQQIEKITAFAKMKQDMAQLNKDLPPIVLNMEFVGNPGTAKTTVARVVAGIFYELGLLASNELIEVGRADLVARYVGQTADNVKKVFERAKGKLLFIDEAYSLVDGQNGDFGDEAINTIVQEMENNRNNTIVIFAGYPNEMSKFFSRNPGLRSRVPFSVNFSDYSAAEMVQIVELEAKKRGFSISPQAMKKLAFICEAAQGPAMGNGRFCRNLVEKAILNYAARVYGEVAESACKDYVLIESDFFSSEIVPENRKANYIGFKLYGQKS